MDDTIIASIISGGVGLVGIVATATIALVSAHSTRKANEATNQAGIQNTIRVLEAAREERIWDKRSDTYVHALMLTKHRQDTRINETRILKYDAETEKRIKEAIDGYQLPAWREVDSRLLAYASRPVLDALREAGEANSAVVTAIQTWTDLSDRAKAGSPGAPAGDEVIDARKAIDTAVAEANSKDELLLDVMRAELHSKPGHDVALPDSP